LDACLEAEERAEVADLEPEERDLDAALEAEDMMAV